MKRIFFTPGPSQLYPTVYGHIQKMLKKDLLSTSHRTVWFQETFKNAVSGLKNLLQIPTDYHIVFVSSGTEAMERIIQNSVSKKSFHFVNGSFSERWYEIAKELKKDPKKEEVEFGKGFHKVPTIPPGTELICFTHNETSSGVAINLELIYAVADKYPKALIGVDTVSSAPYVDLDYKKLDYVFFSVQKLFGLPAGLGIVILSPRALKKTQLLQKKGEAIGTYHNFLNLVTAAKDNFTTDTPNVFDIYLLSKVVADFQKKGIGKIRKETEEKARYIYNFFDKHQLYKPFVKDIQDRSQTIIAIHVGKDGGEIKEKLEANGMTIGNGYGPLKDTQLRIANLPAVTMQDIKNLLKLL